MMGDFSMRDVLDICKALADEQRLRILYALRGSELCVCQLIALLKLAPSTISKHLMILRSARLIENRKSGRWMYYSLTKDYRSCSTGKILALLFKDMEKTDRIIEDQKRLKQIYKEDLDHLCRRIFGKP
jgi:DNA-binding transcriptional ArsR family regulator